MRTTEATGDDVLVTTQRPRSGNFYFLPKVLVAVSGRYIDDKQTFQINLTRVLAPDKNRRLFAEYIPSGFADDSITFVVNNKGLLDGAFTVHSQDRVGSILESLTASAINVWKISSYGSLGGQVTKAPGTPKTAAKPEPFKPFEEVFDPYTRAAQSGIVAGDFIIHVVSIAGVQATNNKAINLPLALETVPRVRHGLVFRAPEVVDIEITHAAVPVPAPTPSGRSSAPGASPGSTDETDLGNATAPSISSEQKTKDVFTWTIFAASAATSVKLVTGVKTADPRPGAETAFSFSRAAFVKKGTAVAFVDGELLGLEIKKPSEILAFVKTPERILGSVLTAIPEVIKISDERANRELAQGTQAQTKEAARLKAETALLGEQKANLQAQTEFLKAQKDLEAAKKVSSPTPTATATPAATPSE